MTSDNRDTFTSDNRDIFTSWKEIAAHFGKGVRTVQRWERQFGLPVQRPNTRSKGIVCASRAELDQWMQTEWSSREVKARKSDPAITSRNSFVTEGIASMRELQASNRELLKQLRECLERLNANCEKLHGNLGEDNGNGKQKSSAA